VLGTRGITVRTQGTPLCVLQLCTFALWHLAVYNGVWCYLLPHLPVPVLPPPDQQSGILRTAWRAWRAWCVAPWHLAPVCSNSLIAAYVAFLHVVLELELEYKRTSVQAQQAQALVLLRSCMVMLFPPPASLYLVYNFLACQNSCHGRNYLRIFACLVFIVAQ
jgi:hypothetical protein